MEMGGCQVPAPGGPQVWVNNSVQLVCHGHPVGRCRVSVRAEPAILAGTPIRVRRMVPVVAFARFGPDTVAAALVRLNAMTASTSQPALAANDFDGRWARAEFFRSAWTCSMIACPRWVLSAVTVSRVLVVKNAWNRQVSNRVGCPATALGFRS